MPAGISAALGVVGSLANGIIGSEAASNAASQEEQAGKNALSYSQGFYNDTAASLQPFINGGGNAFTQLQQLLGIGQPGAGMPTSPLLQLLGIGPQGQQGSINPSSFVASPGYNYQLQQGTNAVTNSAAANGGLGGNALRALQQTGQGLANQSWNQYLGTVGPAWQQMIGNVAGVANTGYNAVNSLGQFGQNQAQMGSSDLLGIGNAQAAGTIGSANAITGAIKEALQSIGSGGGGFGGGGGGGGIMSMFGGGGTGTGTGMYAGAAGWGGS